MNDNDLIEYCDMHSETQRALFSGGQINRMIHLAGYPKHFVGYVDSKVWISLHEEMKELVKLAKARRINEDQPIAARHEVHSIPNNVISFEEHKNRKMHRC